MIYILIAVGTLATVSAALLGRKLGRRESKQELAEAYQKHKEYLAYIIKLEDELDAIKSNQNKESNKYAND